MGKMNKIDPIDELLRILYLENIKTEDSDVYEPLYHLDKLPRHAKMSKYRKQQLFEKLSMQKAAAPTLGQLLNDYIRNQGFTIEKLAGQVKLAPQRLNSLIEDELIPNLVPVVRLKNLLTILQISFEEAKKGIWRTYEYLEEKNIETGSIESMQVSSRISHGKNKTTNITGEGDLESLYLNREALEKYVNRLEELIENK